MTSNWLRQLGAALVGAAFLTASAGLVASPGQEPVTARQPDRQAGDGKTSPDDQVEAIVREYEEARVASRRRFAEALKNREKARAETEKSSKLHKDIAGRFLELAEHHPRTNAAEQALTWVVGNDRPFDRSPEADRAREILARDHVRSDRIKAVLAATSPTVTWGSPTTEDLLRRVLERNPYLEIRGLACYRLAEILVERAGRVRIWQLLGSPPRSEDRRIRGGPEQFALMSKSDPGRLEDEAALLLERVIAEFPWVLENQADDNRLGRQLGESAKTEVDRLRRLSIGKPAPEIDGVDLDGKRMKLSDYRGKVVVLYFSPYFSFSFLNTAASGAAGGFRKLQPAIAGKPVAIVGVVAWQFDEFRKEFRANGLPVRFWADEAGRDNIFGRIHTAWNVTRESPAATYYVLDPRGTIRYYLPGDPTLIEKAVTKLLEEPQPPGRAG
jgi:peroxiredoxin